MVELHRVLQCSAVCAGLKQILLRQTLNSIKLLDTTFHVLVAVAVVDAVVFTYDVVDVLNYDAFEMCWCHFA